MKKLLEKRADVVFFLKLTLIRRNPELEKKSKAVVCSKSLKILDEAFEGATLPMTECQTKELEENTKFMEANGFNGVPVTLFPDGSVQVGFMESPAFEKRIDEALAGMKGDTTKGKAPDVKRK
jgi:thiol:disulfide interchange protein DsbC